MRPGIRVIRGPDWRLGDQDGGAGYLGTVINIFPNNSVLVRWDIGTETTCRAGLDGAFDLRLYDNAQIGVEQPSCICDGSCLDTSDNKIYGFRWKCLECSDRDNCTPCYMMTIDEVCMGHTFVRYVTPFATVVRVPPRKKSKRIPLYGIFPGAEVTKIASGGSQQDEKIGIVKELITLQPDAYRSAVKVEWLGSPPKKTEEGEPYYPIYRVGADRKVELKLVTAASPGTVYIDHLPVLDLTMPVNIQFNEGDRVRVDVNLDTYKPLLKEYGGWIDDLEKVLGEEGIVLRIADPNRRLLTVKYDSIGIVNAMYMNVLTKISTILAGDIVTIIQDQNKMKKLQIGHGGWREDFLSIFGATGRVVRIDDCNDAIVDFKGELYVLNQSCLVLQQKTPLTEQKATKRSLKAPEEISEDPYALNLYEKAVKEGTENDRSIRINVVGNYGQGKTTLVKRLLYQQIFEVESTNGIDVEQYKCCRSGAGRLTYSKKKELNDEEILDRLLAVKVTKEEQLCSTSNPGTTEKIIVEHKSQTSLDATDIKYEDSLHHVPLDQTIVQTEEIYARAKYPKAAAKYPERGIQVPVLSNKHKHLFEQEAKKNENVVRQKESTTFNFWDFGGQFIFYATHSLFHSRQAIYLLVFDMSLPLHQFVDEELPVESEQRSVEYYLRFWMNSMHSFVGTEDGHEPVVILVGTHKDKLQGNQLEKTKYKKKYFNDVRELFDDTKVLNHIYTEDFAIDNNDVNDPDLDTLREAILTIGYQRSKTIEIPAKWIQLEKALDTIRYRKIVPIQTVLNINSSTEFPIRDIEQLKLFLQYHHSKGTLIYFDENLISDNVILDPQFLIDAFKCIITSERFLSNDPVLRRMWKLLQNEARLEDSLIDYQWGKDKMFQENKKVLLGYLEKHRIITQAIVFDEATKTSSGLCWYIVPSLLKDVHFLTDLKLFLQGKPMSKLQFVMEFQASTVVELVFHRLLSAVAGKWPTVKYLGSTRSHVMIYKNGCVVHFNNQAGILAQNAKEIRLAFVSCCPSVTVQSKEADLFRRFCESVVQYEFRKLKESGENQSKPYAVKFACNHEDHYGRGSKTCMGQDTKNTAPCPDFLSHDVIFEKAKSEWYIIDEFTNIGSNVELNDKHLSHLSRCIGKNWELLGIELGLTRVQIDHLTADNPTTRMRIYKMLLSWKSFTKTPSLQNLVDALTKVPSIGVDWDGIRNTADAIY